MPQAYQKCAISFGLVHIPIALYTSAASSGISFNQLHKDDLGRIRHKKVCSVCGDEVTADEIAKGFEYSKGNYIVIEDSELEKLKTENDKAFNILQFADISDIEHRYVEKSYYAVPLPGGEKAFELLRLAMRSMNKAAVALAVLGSKEALACLMAFDYGIIASILYFGDELKPMPVSYRIPDASDSELELAKTLISSMQKDFDISEFQDEFSSRVTGLIEEKAHGKKPKQAKQAKKQESVVDLVDALRLSIDAKKPAQKKKRKDAG
ncbi:MAG: Ku protein [Eubacteriaceae bacterium]|nr:Ku protein [Eubacteriaceae bacterium]